MGASAVEVFRALHHGRAAGDPLILPGPWDAASARVFADAGAPALATPSHALAETLGYQDGGGTPPGEMFAAVRRIVRAVDVPVSADIEDGYGLAPRELVDRLIETGAVGCNLEDTRLSAKELKDAREQADFLAEVRREAGDRLFVNARIDVYLRGHPAPTEAAIERGRLYAEAGADCVYPIMAPPERLRALADGIGLPLNAIARPGAAPSPRELGGLGATRITFGPFLHAHVMATLPPLAHHLFP